MSAAEKLKKLSEHDQRLVNEAIAGQLLKVEQRIRWVAGRKSRLPIGSNGRQRCDAELIALNLQADALRAGAR